VAAGLNSLAELFEESKLSKSFLVSELGALERHLLSSVLSDNVEIQLAACKCLRNLLKGKGGTGLHDEGA